MKQGGEVTRYEANLPGKWAVTWVFTVGLVGMLVNVAMWFGGNNVPYLGTISGLLICIGLVARLLEPRHYEVSDSGVTVYFTRGNRTIRWDEVDLMLSTSSLKSRMGVTVPLVPVREGQDEFNRRLLAKLHDQIKFEAEWQARNIEALEVSLSWVIWVVFVPLVAVLPLSLFLIESEVIMNFLWVCMVVGHVLVGLGLRNKGAPVNISQGLISSSNWQVKLSDLTTLRFGVDDVYALIYVNDKVWEAKCPLIMGVIAVRMIARLNPETQISAENRVLQMLPDPNMISQKGDTTGAAPLPSASQPS